MPQSLRGVSAEWAYPSDGARRWIRVDGLWLQDIESLEAISQNEGARRIFLRMAALEQEGRIGVFIVELAGDPEVDDETKGTLTELAHDPMFLHAVEDYCHRTEVAH
jgi:hypothetical protein